jgi:hypothetical protein
MNKLFANLAFPIPQLVYNVQAALPPPVSSTESVIYYPADTAIKLFREEFLGYMERVIGLKVLNVLVFIQKPHFADQRIHTDNKQSKTSDFTFTINWIFGERPSRTVWYEPLNGYEGYKTVNNRHQKVIDGILQESPGYEITQFDPDCVRYLACTDSQGPLLLNTSVPHRGMNLSNKHRYSVSLRFQHDLRNADELFAKFAGWIA